MLKRITLFAVIICLLPAITLSAEYTGVSVSTANTNPYPVEPGMNVELSIEIVNTGAREIEDMVLELKPNKPFTLLEDAEKEISILPIGSSRVVEYELFVDESAISTVYEIPIQISYESNLLNKEVSVNVQGKPDFKLIEMGSDMLTPGDQKNISVTISNVGSGNAKRTTTTFTSDSAYIKPIFSGGNVYIGDFNAGETKDFEFLILVGSDADYGVYTGTITLGYQEETGDEISTSFDVGILVSGEPKLQIIQTEVDLQKQKFNIELSNIGTAEAKALNAKLLINGQVFDVDYVTSVKIDKKTTLKFDLVNGGTGELVLSYEGPDNRKYEQTETVAWNVPFKIPSTVWFIAIILVVYVMWKKKWYKKIF